MLVDVLAHLTNFLTSATIPRRPDRNRGASASGAGGAERRTWKRSTWLQQGAALLRDMEGAMRASRPCLNWWPWNIRLYAERLRHNIAFEELVLFLLAAHAQRRLIRALIAAGYEARPDPLFSSPVDQRFAHLPPRDHASRRRFRWGSAGHPTRWSTRIGGELSCQRSAGGHAQPRRRPAAANVGGCRDQAGACGPPSASDQVGQQAAQFAGGDGHVGIEAFVGGWRGRGFQHHVEQLDLLQRQRVGEHEGDAVVPGQRQLRGQFALADVLADLGGQSSVWRA